MSLTDSVRTAHGDAWQVLGGLRAASGGGATELPGIRLMASGLPHPRWNNGDVTEPAAVNLDAVRAWYEARRVPWGVRVPAGLAWPHGRHLLCKRLMALPASAFVPAPEVPNLRIRTADAADAADVLHIDAVSYEEDPEVERPWIEPHLSATGVTVALAELGGTPVGTGYTVRSDGRAGPCVYVAGIAVLPSARGRGVGAAVTSWLVARGISAGAHLAHLHPDDDGAARIYARLGFLEVAGFDVYVDN